MRVLIVGYGFVGLALGFELTRQGHQVFGLRRKTPLSSDKVLGITSLQADITHVETLTHLPRDFDWVVNCAATGGGTPEDYRQLYVTGNHNLVEWLRARPPQKFVYTSSTSVYGQNDGSVVTETDPTAPLAETARVLVEAENTLLEAYEKWKFPVSILRVAGIYGPGRSYWLKQFRSGEVKLDGDGARYLNMVHLEDVVGAIIATLQGDARMPAVFNVVDDEPVMQRDFFAWLAEQLSKPMPPSVSADAELNRKRGVTNKRVSNQRLKKMLGYQFKYPTFQPGYAAEIAKIAGRTG